MSYDNSCKITYMDAASQDPVAAIERALAALRHSRPFGRGPGGSPSAAPWLRGGPRFGGHDPGDHAHLGPHEGRLAGAARIRLLAALRARDAQSVSELAEAIGVDQPRASRLINDSAERGLVTRRADDRDARRSVVQLTDAGRALLEGAEARRRSAVADAVASFTPQETATFAELLTRFATALSERPRTD